MRSMPELILHFRGLLDSDAQCIAGWMRDGRIEESLAIAPWPSEKEMAETLRSHAERRVVVAVESSGDPVGFAVLATPAGRWAGVGQLSMAVDPDRQGCGIGTALVAEVHRAAVEVLGLHRVELLVYASNEAAINLYKKVGYSIEGTIRYGSRQHGRPADGHMMAWLPRGEDDHGRT